MKRGGPLKRKTEMPRGNGFKRPSKSSRNPNEPAWGEKPRAKKSKRAESPEMKAYRKANRLCEITMHLPIRHPARVRDWRRDSVHHIQWGHSSRIDIPTNLIRTTAVIHDWIHANADAGRIVSLYAKLRKGELNWDELDRIYTGNALRPMSYRDYVSTLEPREDWVRKLWLQLTQGSEG